PKADPATSAAPDVAPAPRAVAPPVAVVPFDAREAARLQQAWADHLGSRVEFTAPAGIALRVIPPGEFLMGSPDKEIQPQPDPLGPDDEAKEIVERSFKNETPQHRVRITRPFALGKTEVTVGQFRQFVKARDGYKTRVETELGGGYGFQDGVLQKTRDKKFN